MGHQANADDTHCRPPTTTELPGTHTAQLTGGAGIGWTTSEMGSSYQSHVTAQPAARPFPTPVLLKTPTKTHPPCPGRRAGPVHNRPKLETTQTPINSKMDK